MPILTPHLIRRGGVFYWRKRLPRPLDTLVGRSHYTISLGTADLRFAVRLSRALLEAMDDLRDKFAKAPLTITREMAEQAVKQTVQTVVAAIKDGTYQSGRDAGGKFGQPSWLGTILPSLHASWNTNSSEMVAAELNEVFAGFGVSLDPNSAEFSAVARSIVHRLLKVLPDACNLDRVQFEKIAGGSIASDGEKVEALLTQAFGPVRSAGNFQDADELRLTHARLSEVANEFIAARSTRGQWRKDTIDDYKRSLKIFLQLMGDPQLHKIDASMAKKFKRLLDGVPARNGRDCYLSKPDPKKQKGRRIGFPIPIQDQIGLCQDIRDALSCGETAFVMADGRIIDEKQMNRAVEVLSTVTVNKYLTFFTTLWNSDSIPSSLRKEAPFSRLLYPKPKKTNVSGGARRDEFELEDLEELFATPVWRGNSHPRFRTKAGSKIYWDAKFWVPLIALYTGMRREEVCQLSLKNVDESHGIVFFKLRPSASMVLKSDAAIRDVPIHSELIAIGLMKYLDDVKGSGQQFLFPELVRSKPYDKLGDSVGKWFYNYRNELGIYRPGKDLHSLRTTFIGRSRRDGIDREMVNFLVGHAQKTMGEIHYGAKFSIADKKREIEKFSLKLGLFGGAHKLEIISLDAAEHPAAISRGKSGK